jgi:hypothetical protein
MPINDINGVDWSSINDINGVAASGIAKVSGVEVPPTYLLDTYTGASAAYSVRRLNSLYTGACMRVREASGNTETDIGFDSNGYIDTAAIASHCGNGTQDGFVTKWYDQSQAGGTGSGNDAEMTTSSQQPRIYHGTNGVETDNGVAALRHDNNTSGSGRIGLNLQSNIRTTLGASSVFCVFNLDQTFTSGFQNVWSLYQTSRLVYGRTSDPSYGHVSGSNSDTTQSNYYKAWTGTDRTSQKVRTVIYDGSSTTAAGKPDLDFAENGTLRAQASNGYAGFNQPGNGINSLMYRENGTTQGVRGYMQEWIVWDSDESSNRSGIESNIQTYFSIT